MVDNDTNLTKFIIDDHFTPPPSPPDSPATGRPATSKSSLHSVRASILPSGTTPAKVTSLQTLMPREVPTYTNPARPHQIVDHGVNPTLDNRTTKTSLPHLQAYRSNQEPDEEDLAALREIAVKMKKLPACVYYKGEKIQNEGREFAADILKGKDLTQEEVEGDFSRWDRLSIKGNGANYEYSLTEFSKKLKGQTSKGELDLENAQKAKVNEQLGIAIGAKVETTGEINPKVLALARLFSQKSAGRILGHVFKVFGKDVLVQALKYNHVQIEILGDKIKFSLTQLYASQEIIDDKMKPLGYIPTKLEIEVPLTALDDPDKINPASITTTEQYGSFCGTEEQAKVALGLTAR